MNRALAGILLLSSCAALAQQRSTDVVQEEPYEDTWAGSARFFSGVRGGVAIPPGGDGLASTLGLELGVSAKQGVGFGLHLIGMQNPPAVVPLGIPKTNYAFGAAADLRFYIQTVEPLTLYPTLSLGFVGGTANTTGRNVVLPLINPGFGARVKFDKVYVAFEFGAASFHIPFVNVCIGWEPDRKKPTRYAAATPPPVVEEPPVIVKPRSETASHGTKRPLTKEQPEQTPAQEQEPVPEIEEWK